MRKWTNSTVKRSPYCIAWRFASKLDQVMAEVDAAFDTVREQGRLNRLPEIIQEARAAIRARLAA